MFVGLIDHLMNNCQSPDTHPPCPRQQPSAHQVQFRQAAVDEGPSSIPPEPAVADLGLPTGRTNLIGNHRPGSRS